MVTTCKVFAYLRLTNKKAPDFVCFDLVLRVAACFLLLQNEKTVDPAKEKGTMAQNSDAVKQAMFEELQIILNPDSEQRKSAEARLAQLKFTECKRTRIVTGMPGGG